ncbi:MAG: type II toxin-antitoxin system ParD family antitoxin [bacterium]
MSTIHVSLTPKLNDFVQELLDTGLYGNVSEIIREALREKYQSQTEAQSQKLIKLQKAIQVGLDQAEKSEFSNENIKDYLSKLKEDKSLR